MSCNSDEPIPSTSSSIAGDEPGFVTSLGRHERKCSSDDGIHYVDDDDGVEFALDARQLNQVHEELEKLNIATDVINSLEFQLDESRLHFNQIHAKWSQRLEEMKKKYSSAIQKSRPYYDTLQEEQAVRADAQEAATRFQRATSMLQVAKLQVKLTQESLSRQKVVEPECLEVLNEHIQRVATAESERVAAEEAHRALSLRVQQICALIRQMEKDYARSIKKSRHYFEQREEFMRVMDHQKGMIKRLENEGTARAPKYTVLYDDNEFTIDVLEAITYYLCYGHQIVFMPTSLPSPLYIANRYAERGRMLYQRWVEHDKHSDVNYHIVSNKLCFYNSKKLFGRRINA